MLVALFWTTLYALLGEYRDIFRKSRLSELIRLARVSAAGRAGYLLRPAAG
ncbi:MAG: hypothetical protein WKG07_19650 [Hymenobacter sp.]